MVATTIPNLWPVEALQEIVLSPEEILRIQARHLQQESRGLIEADVVKSISKDAITLRLDIIAPSLNHYRQTILEFVTGLEMLYPIVITQTIQDEDLFRKPSVTQQVFGQAVRIATNGVPILGEVLTGLIQPTKEIGPSAPSTILYSEAEFFNWLGGVLSSPQVVAVIQSLLARIQVQKEPNDAATPKTT